MGKLSSTFSSDPLRIVAKTVIALGAFLVLNIILYIPLNFMYFHSYGGNSGAQINNILRQNSDVFIFGASRASHHYNTDLFSNLTGVSTFNAGDDGKNSVYQLGLLKMLLKNHKPKLIIYEIGDLSGHDGGNVDLFPYYYRDSDIRSLLQKRDAWISTKMIFPLYAYNRKLFNIAKGYMLCIKPSLTGYRPIKGNILPSEEKKIKSDFIPEFQRRALSLPDDVCLSSFMEFISECSRQRIALIFVYSPSYMPANPLGEPIIDRLAASNNIKLYDFGINAKYNWNNRLFKDSSHLNSEGADVFTHDFVRMASQSILTYVNKKNLGINSYKSGS